MKIKGLLIIILVLVLTGCSNFREVSVSEDGETRRIMVDNSGEMEIPADPERMVLLRPVDVLNAHLLGADISAVTAAVEDNTFVNEDLDDVEYIEYEDFEAVRDAEPDVIVTSSQDSHSTDYEKIAPTLPLNYSGELLSTYRDRIYLIQLNKMGVILGEQEKAAELADGWMERMTEHRRELSFDPSAHEAAVLVEGDDGFYLYDEYSAYGTEVMYDVLNFNVAEDVEDAIGETPFDQFEVSELSGIGTDYILVNKRPETDSEALRKELADAMNVDSGNILIVSADDFITNDLMSLEGQTNIIMEALE